MKKKFNVYLDATAGTTVEVEIDVPENATENEIADLAYNEACEVASLGDCEAADWTGSFEVTGTDGDDFSFDYWGF